MKLKIRVAVAANAAGEYFAYGHSGTAEWSHLTETFDALDGEQKFWVEAEIDVAEQVIPVVVGASINLPEDAT